MAKKNTKVTREPPPREPEHPNELKLVERAARNAARNHLGARPDLIPDVVGEVRLRWLQRIRQQPPVTDPANWAWKVAQHYSMRLRERENRALELTDETVANFAAASIERQLEVDEALNALDQLLSIVARVVHTTANDVDENIFNMFYFQRMSFEQIAEVTGYSLGQTRQRWYRLMRRVSEETHKQVAADEHLRSVFDGMLRDAQTFHCSFQGLLSFIARKGLDAIRQAIEAMITR